MIKDPKLSLALARLGAGFDHEARAVVEALRAAIDAERDRLLIEGDGSVAPRGLLSLTSSTIPAPPDEPLTRQVRRAMERRARKGGKP